MWGQELFNKPTSPGRYLQFYSHVCGSPSVVWLLPSELLASQYTVPGSVRICGVTGLFCDRSGGGGDTTVRPSDKVKVRLGAGSPFEVQFTSYLQHPENVKMDQIIFSNRTKLCGFTCHIILYLL